MRGRDGFDDLDFGGIRDVVVFRAGGGTVKGARDRGIGEVGVAGGICRIVAKEGFGSSGESGMSLACGEGKLVEGSVGVMSGEDVGPKGAHIVKEGIFIGGGKSGVQMVGEGTTEDRRGCSGVMGSGGSRGILAETKSLLGGGRSAEGVCGSRGRGGEGLDGGFVGDGGWGRRRLALGNGADDGLRLVGDGRGVSFIGGCRRKDILLVLLLLDAVTATRTGRVRGAEIRGHEGSKGVG